MARTTTAATRTLPKTITLLELAALHRHRREDEEAPVARRRSRRSTGVNVKYVEDINDNDSSSGRSRRRCRTGQSVGRDIIVLTDASRLPALLIELGWVEKLDTLGAAEHQEPRSRYSSIPAWDQDRAYSLPWQSGMTGIGYDPNKTDEARSTAIEQLLTDPKLKGKVTMLTEFGDTVGLVMLANGDDPSKVTDASFDRAIADAPEGGRLRSDSPVHRQRLRAAARQGRRLGRRSRGRATWCSSRRTNPGLKWVQPKTGGDDLDRTTC